MKCIECILQRVFTQQRVVSRMDDADNLDDLLQNSDAVISMLYDITRYTAMNLCGWLPSE